MNQEIAVPPPGDFKDRKTGLMIFGVLTMGFGGLCGIFGFLIILARSLPQPAGLPQNAQSLNFALGMYGGLSLLLFALGIGSIMARRWARALLLIFSWMWLVMGLFSVIGMSMAVSSPGFVASVAHPPGQPALSADAVRMIAMGALGVVAIFFLVLPGIWIFFYGSRHVKATCEARNPKPCWTDRSPLPVLALSLGLGACAVMMLAFPLAYRGVLPAFGVILSGIPGSVACVILAIFWGYVAWALYTLRLHGWWMVFVTMPLFSISSMITYSRHDIVESYRLMGYPEQQIAFLQKNNVFQGERLVLMMLVSVLPWLFYLLWVRKFFPKAAAKS